MAEVFYSNTAKPPEIVTLQGVPFDSSLETELSMSLKECGLGVQIYKSGNRVRERCEICNKPYCTLAAVTWNKRMGTVNIRLKWCKHGDGLTAILAKVAQ